MRRFSQRNSLVTLNEINITPLLDLAFVLLVIFIITRPLLEQSIPLNLPKGGSPSGKVEAKDRMTVEISPKGDYRLNSRTMPLNEIVVDLAEASKRNPNMFVSIRADEASMLKYSAAVWNACQKRGIVRFEMKTFPEK